MEELTIKKYNNNHTYFIIYGCYSADSNIAKKLNISLNKYKKILLKNGAFYRYEKEIPYLDFKTKQDALNAIEDLTPYLIMKKLTE